MAEPSPFLVNADRTDPYKTANNQPLLKGLFYETSASRETVVYTLKDQEHAGYPSLKALYLQEADPTEYSFAVKHLGGVEHWEILQQCTWMRPYVAQWRYELDLKLKSEAVANILKEGRSGSKQSLMANRWLAEKGWASKEKKGRPTKEAISQEANKIAMDQARINDDFERIVGNA